MPSKEVKTSGRIRPVEGEDPIGGWEERHDVGEVFNGEHLGRGENGGNNENQPVAERTHSSILTDHDEEVVILDDLLRTGTSVLFPDGETSNVILKYITKFMRKTDFNITFNEVVDNPKSRLETLSSQIKAAESMTEEINLIHGAEGQSLLPSTFEESTSCLVEGPNGLVATGNKFLWTKMGHDLDDGIKKPDANAFKNFYDAIGKIRFLDEVTETVPGQGRYKVKAAEDLARLDQREQFRNTVMRLEVAIKALEITRAWSMNQESRIPINNGASAPIAKAQG